MCTWFFGDMNGILGLSFLPKSVNAVPVYKRFLSNIRTRASERVIPASLWVVSSFALVPYLRSVPAFAFAAWKNDGLPADGFAADAAAGVDASVLLVVVASAGVVAQALALAAVEASAFGAPSLINCKGVGATELLKGDGFLAVDLDKSLDALAADVDNILSNDAEQIAAVREEAYQRAMSWDEDASGRTIFSRLRALV